MLRKRKYHAIIIIGIMSILHPLAFNLGASIGISLGFGASFGLIRWELENL